MKNNKQKIEEVRGLIREQKQEQDLDFAGLQEEAVKIFNETLEEVKQAPEAGDVFSISDKFEGQDHRILNMNATARVWIDVEGAISRDGKRVNRFDIFVVLVESDDRFVWEVSVEETVSTKVDEQVVEKPTREDELVRAALTLRRGLADKILQVLV